MEDEKEYHNLLDLGLDAFYLNESVDVACAQFAANSLLGSIIVDKLIFKTPFGNRKITADGMFVIIGQSGTEKTTPIEEAERISKQLRFDIPAVFTVESLRDYFSKHQTQDGVNPQTGESTTIELPEYEFDNFGLIYWDEMSQQFSDAQKKTYMSGTIEAMASVYNHHLKSTYLKGEGVVKRSRPMYISMIGSMVPAFLKDVPNTFWSQGLAGRINWKYIDPMDYEINKGDWNDFSHETRARHYLARYQKALKIILDNMSNLNPEEINVQVDEEANTIIKQFKEKCESVWQSRAVGNDFGWEHAYLKRLPEMAAKSAFRRAIGRHFMLMYQWDASSQEWVKKEDGKTWADFKYITKDDMEYGKKHAMRSKKDIEDMFIKLKAHVAKDKSPQSRMMAALLEAPNRMLTSEQWRLNAAISPNVFTKYKKKLLVNKKVMRVNKAAITDLEEKIRLGVGTSSKVYTILLGK